MNASIQTIGASLCRKLVISSAKVSPDIRSEIISRTSTRERREVKSDRPRQLQLIGGVTDYFCFSPRKKIRKQMPGKKIRKQMPGKNIRKQMPRRLPTTWQVIFRSDGQVKVGWFDQSSFTCILCICRCAMHMHKDVTHT
ncbi:uncharacterized protein LOC105696637 [Orussus abietinus]|uniref:uncharacterized protein LOC105696637 n=1 Tax=Orussus abietinus TaxID=222816 RepID=UPI0006262A25|nr:uncharacterized protein LOC105696637 [Orussus abietinus]XP_012274681.1 uncharacterized protein LOC105696637 [Orussus abietinus]